MSPGRNKPGPGTIRASASAVLAGEGWPARPARPVLAGGPPPPVSPGPEFYLLSRLDPPRRTPINASLEAIQPFFRPGARKGAGASLFASQRAPGRNQADGSSPCPLSETHWTNQGRGRITLRPAPPRPSLSGVDSRRSPVRRLTLSAPAPAPAPHPSPPDSTPDSTRTPPPRAGPVSDRLGAVSLILTGALANLSPHYAPSGRLTGCASLLDAMGVSGRAVEDLSLVDCGGLRFLAEGGAARPSLLRPLSGACRPVRIRRRIRGREEDGVI